MDESTVDHSTHRRRRREDRAARCWAVVRKGVLGLSLAIACQSALAQAMYRIKPLGFLGGCTTYAPAAVGLTGADHVAGDACYLTQSRAILWKNDGDPMVDIGPPQVWLSEAVAMNASGLIAGEAFDSTGSFAFESPGVGTPLKIDGWGGGNTQPNSMNDQGQLAGTADLAGDTTFHAFVWKNDGAPILDLGTLGGDFSYGNGINASGQVVGSASISGNVVVHAFVWKNDGSPMLDLGTLGGVNSAAYYINSSGQIIGWSALPGSKTNPNSHVFLWRNDGTPMQDLGTLGGVLSQSFPTAFNDAGQVAGWANTHGKQDPHAFVWLNDGTPMRNLGTLGGTQSFANAMNSSGQVTGKALLPGNTAWHAFLWRNDGTKIQDLNRLIDPTDPLKPYITLTNGEVINDFGDVAAEGTDSRTGLAGLYLLQGTVLTLAPRSLAFGSHPINTTSAAKSVAVTNTSTKVVAITSIALTGAAAGQFASTNNCGSSLVSHATCTIKVTFKPTTKGAKSATLNVNGGGGGLRSVTLTGTGT